MAATKAGKRERDWVITPPYAARDELARAARISPLLAQVLLGRGVSEAPDVRRFLLPDFSTLGPPETLPNAVTAAARLAAAVRANRRIVIYGDYDVDGVSATAILWHALRLAGARADFYIPSRLDEGYGLNLEAVTALADDGAEVIVTVDCGITAGEEAELARRRGVELIITDHHEPGPELPGAACVVHPWACGESPNRNLCGAGVAFKVAWALAQELCGSQRVNDAYRQFLLEATAFAALGTVADVVPLTGENRVIAAFGLKHLCQTSNPGLQALIEVSGVAGKTAYDDYDVGFRLAPRLNAIGRLGHARLAVELFTRAGGDRAREIAATLDAHNRRRQEMERAITRQAETMVIERGFDRDSCHGIVLASADWHAGVIGIVAARLTERFGRPTVLIALDKGLGQGSGRSVRHFPLHEVLRACEAHLLSHGGHAMAAGVRLREEQVAAFTDAFIAEAGRRLTAKDLRPKLQLDAEVELTEVTTEVVDMMQRLAPHGPGNPAPRLATTEVELVGAPRVVGRAANHLQLTVRQGGTHRKAIAFGFGEQAEELGECGRLRLAFEPIMNEWNGRRSAELRVVDVKRADSWPR